MASPTESSTETASAAAGQAPAASPGLPPTTDPEALLAQLRDIQLPPQPEAWPPAPGWWLTGLFVLLLLAAGHKLRRQWQRHQREKRFVSEARSELRALEERFRAGAAPERVAAELNVLVRRVALSLYARSSVAGLHGDDWLAYLARITRNRAFLGDIGTVLASAPYQRERQDPGLPEKLPAAFAAVDGWLQISTRGREEEA